MTQIHQFVSIYKHHKTKSPEKTLRIEVVLQQIKGGAFSLKVNSCRKKLETTGKDAYDAEKETLPSFTPSGTFKNRRLASRLEKYSNLIILDIDKLSSTDEAVRIRIESSKLSYTRAAFLSPSAIGVKILIWVNSGPNEHKLAYNSLKSWYSTQLGISIDESGSDVSRLCFFSYDPDLFDNPKADFFDYRKYPVAITNKFKPLTAIVHNSIKSDDLFTKAVKFSENIRKFETGSRNNFVLLLAGNLNRLGVPISEALQMVISRYASSDFEDSEIESTVRSAYRNSSEHGKFTPGQDDDATKKPKRLREEEIKDFFREYQITPEKINDTTIVEILLLSSVDSEYESLNKFCMSGIIDLIPIIGQDKLRQITNEIIQDQPDDKNYWLNHDSSEITSLADKIFQNDLTQQREEIHRIKICLYRIAALDKILQRKVLESRFVPLNEISAFLIELNMYHAQKEHWQNEMELLIRHLLDFRL